MTPRVRRIRRMLVPLAAVLMMLTGLTAIAPAQAAITSFATSLSGAMGRVTYAWDTPAPVGPVYVIFASQSTGKDWVFQLSSDVETTPARTITFNTRKVADADCTSYCFTAKVAGTGSGNYLPPDVYTTQMTFLNSLGTITKSATSNLTVTTFSVTPDVSSPKGQKGVNANGMTVDFDIGISQLTNSRVVKFTGLGPCSASTASVRLQGAGAASGGVRVQVQYDPFTATASSRLRYSQTGSPTPYETYPQSSAGPTWTPGSSGTPSPSWVTPTPTVTSTPSFSPTAISTITTATEGKLIRGCSYEASVEYNSVLLLPGMPDREPYVSQFSTWYTNSTTSPSPTPTGICTSPAAAFTASPSPSCAHLQPPGHAVTSSFVVPDVPDVPTGLSATSGDGEVAIQFTAPDSNYSDINRYEVTLDGGSHYTVFYGGSPGPLRVPGTNGTQYTYQIRAGNEVGVSPWSEPITGTPMTTPSAPSVEITRGNAQATVSITGPVNDGGSAITNYQYSLDDGSSWTALVPASVVSPFTIGGLTNGITYRIRVRAVNEAGPGAGSSAVDVTPCTTPGKPASLVVAERDGAVEVVTGSSTSGGCAITDHEYRLDDGAWTSSGDADGSFTVSGLTNGSDYVVRVRARNEVGVGPASDPASANPRALPGAPTGLVYTPGDRGGTIAFTAPDNGGRVITGYQYQTADGPWTDGDPPATTSPITLQGFTNGQEYLVRIRAVNSVGDGPASEWTPVNPGTVATPPRDVAVTAGDRSAQVRFTPPADDGGRSITGYEYSLDDGGHWTAALTGSPLQLSELANGTAYALRLRAVNEFGSGAASAAVEFAPIASGGPAAQPNSPGAAAPSKLRQTAKLPPRRIKLTGITVLTPRGARTNAGQAIQTRVSGSRVAQGEVQYFTIERGPAGETSIRTFGHRNLRIVLRQNAPATGEYDAFRRRTVYVGGNRQ